MTDEIEFVQKPPLWSTNRLWAIVALAFALMWFLILVWPTGDRYEHTQGKLVRIDRWSGEVDALTDSGWVPLSPAARIAADSTR